MTNNKAAVKIYLQSFIDVITNSSTEVFTVCTQQTVNAIKTLLGSLTGLSKEEVNENFNITLNICNPDGSYYYAIKDEIINKYGSDIRLYYNGMRDKIFEDIKNGKFNPSLSFETHVHNTIIKGKEEVSVNISTENKIYKPYIKMIEDLLTSVKCDYID